VKPKIRNNEILKTINNPDIFEENSGQSFNKKLFLEIIFDFNF